MNRTVLYGGVAAIVALVGAAGYLVYTGRQSSNSSDLAGQAGQGPDTLNTIKTVIDRTSTPSQDGHRLTIGFKDFELAAKAGETTSSIFSTTWHLNIAPDEKVLVGTATLNGFMKSTGTPPVPAATPVTGPAAPAASGATPAVPAPADAAAPAPTADPAATPPSATPPSSATTPATAKPAAPVPVGPVAGDGVARVIVQLGGETTVTEWRDISGAGSARKLSKAISFAATSADLRNAGAIPVTVTVELSGGTAADTLSSLNSIDLQLFVENAPLPVPVSETATPPVAATTDAAPAKPPAAESGPAVKPPAAPAATAPATPPATTTP